MMTTLPNRVSALFADPFKTMLRDFEREFQWTANGSAHAVRKIAPLSLWSDGESVFVEIDVPGVALSDLDVSVENGCLTIRGQRKEVERHEGYICEERIFGQFERSVMLNEWVDPGTIEATLSGGVLRLKLCKKPEAQRQKVTINCCDGSSTKRLDASN